MHAFGVENLPTLVRADRQEKDDGFVVSLDKNVVGWMFSVRGVLIIVHAVKYSEAQLERAMDYVSF